MNNLSNGRDSCDWTHLVYFNKYLKNGNIIGYFTQKSSILHLKRVSFNFFENFFLELLLESRYVNLLICLRECMCGLFPAKKKFFELDFYKKRTRFLSFFGHVIGTLLEVQEKSNEETQYIAVKNDVHHKILWWTSFWQGL